MSWSLTPRRRAQLRAALIWAATLGLTAAWIATSWNWSKPW